jgi:DNA-binding MarR family transcriptional regulator
MKAMPVILTLYKIMEKNKKDYCFPSQKKILELLDIRQGIKISKATLNRWMRVIEDAGCFVRRRRIKRDPVYGMMFKSTLYFMTLKGLHLLKRMGVPCRTLFDKVLNKIKGHFPSLKNAPRDPQDPGPGLEKLKAIAGGIVTKFVK